MTDLRVDNVSKQFATRAGELTVLEGVSLVIDAPATVAVTGPSGSGKSTLLALMGTLERPTSGRIALAGRDPAELDDDAVAALRARQIGFVFQDSHLLGQCTVLENVLIPTIATPPTSDDAIKRARRLLDRVGLAERLDHRPAELSGGERQRAALARAMIHRPVLLLADEPTGNLDRSSADDVARLLLELQEEEGGMLVVATHSQRLAQRMERCFELDGGKLSEVNP